MYFWLLPLQWTSTGDKHKGWISAGGRKGEIKREPWASSRIFFNFSLLFWMIISIISLIVHGNIFRLGNKSSMKSIIKRYFSRPDFFSRDLWKTGETPAASLPTPVTARRAISGTTGIRNNSCASLRSRIA